MNARHPIVVIKKKGGHAGHHGGAWKVAYADFVTAMMALFIVLWLMNTSKAIQNAVAGYFQDPRGVADKAGRSIVANGGGEAILPKDDMNSLKKQLEKTIKQIPHFDKLKNHIIMTITPEGLRIDLTEGPNGTFFGSGSPALNTDGQDLVAALAEQLGKLPNKISVEGHTDAKPYAKGGNYSNWELSADRANSARRLLQGNGVGTNQVTEVRGFADQHPLDAKDPFDPSNRRISLFVHYLAAGSDKENRSEMGAIASQAGASAESNSSSSTGASGSSGGSTR
ncbi:MAG TPA: flagellar motor protein MotB [Candidatus Dormibacteraeota bacterium]|nr:flagellar motor protein MotB [Candidatus Dormibacteraeota bacterium]